MKLSRKFIQSIATVSLLGLGSLAQAALVTVSDATYGGFDASTGTRTFQITQNGSVGDVDIAIDFAKCDGRNALAATDVACVGQNFSYNSEIVFRLTSPGGTTVHLVNPYTYGGATPGSGRQTVVFDDEAATVVGGATVVSGTFRPVGLLAAFDGENPFGTWTLFIQDTTYDDALTYFSSRLEVTNNVPEPGALALVGLALGGLGLARRRSTRTQG